MILVRLRRLQNVLKVGNTAVQSVCGEGNAHDQDSQFSNLLTVIKVTKVGSFEEIYGYFGFKMFRI